MPKKPKIQPKKVTAWSYSAVKMFEECPARFKYTKIDRLPSGPRGPALIKGDRIHQEAETYLKAGGKLSESLDLFDEEFADLRQRRARAEAQWAFRVNWTECKWFDKDTWIRIMLDSYYLDEVKIEGKTYTAAFVIDYKTGKLWEGYGEQLEVYALGAFKKFPEVDIVIPALWFLEQGEIVGGLDETMQMPDTRQFFFRDEWEKKLEKKWTARGNKALKAKTYPARPGRGCRFCNYANNKGGPCKYDSE